MHTASGSTARHSHLIRASIAFFTLPLRAVIEKGPASVIKVPPPEATYLATGWALPASGHDVGGDGSCRNVALRSSAHVMT
jgi:hypothetical protein